MITPYTSRCEKYGGGVVSVSLYEVREVLRALFDHRKDCFTHIECREGYAPTEILLPEDTGLYTQTLNVVRGVAEYEHKLILTLDGFEPRSRLLVAELAQRGVVAVVRTQTETLLVGWCDALQCAMPLRIMNAAGSSGQRLGQCSSQTVTLVAKTPFEAKSYK